MPKFRNTLTCRVVEMPEDSSALGAMERSKRWEPVEAPTAPATTSEPEDSPSPKAKNVRAWAKAEGIEVPARGPLPDDVVEAYKAAQAGE